MISVRCSFGARSSQPDGWPLAIKRLSLVAQFRRSFVMPHTRTAIGIEIITTIEDEDEGESGAAMFGLAPRAVWTGVEHEGERWSTGCAPTEGTDVN